jgi:hypothetical protein
VTPTRVTRRQLPIVEVLRDAAAPLKLSVVAERVSRATTAWHHTNTVAWHLAQLEAKGVVCHTGNRKTALWSLADPQATYVATAPERRAAPATDQAEEKDPDPPQRTWRGVGQWEYDHGPHVNSIFDLGRLHAP